MAADGLVRLLRLLPLLALPKPSLFQLSSLLVPVPEDVLGVFTEEDPDVVEED